MNLREKFEIRKEWWDNCIILQKRMNREIKSLKFAVGMGLCSLLVIIYYLTLSQTSNIGAYGIGGMILSMVLSKRIIGNGEVMVLDEVNDLIKEQKFIDYLYSYINRKKNIKMYGIIEKDSFNLELHSQEYKTVIMKNNNEEVGVLWEEMDKPISAFVFEVIWWYTSQSTFTKINKQELLELLQSKMDTETGKLRVELMFALPEYIYLEQNQDKFEQWQLVEYLCYLWLIVDIENKIEKGQHLQELITEIEKQPTQQENVHITNVIDSIKNSENTHQQNNVVKYTHNELNEFVSTLLSKQ